MLEKEPKLGKPKSKAEEFLEREKEKEKFAKERFEEIEKEFKRIQAIPKNEREPIDNHQLVVYDALLKTRGARDLFLTEQKKEKFPGINKHRYNSIVLVRWEKVHWGETGDSQSGVANECFPGLDLNIREDLIEFAPLVREKVLANLLEIQAASPFDGEQQKKVLEKLKVGEEEVWGADMPGTEIVFAKKKREWKSSIAEERKKRNNPGYTEAIMIRFYNPEERAKEIEKAEKTGQ